MTDDTADDTDGERSIESLLAALHEELDATEERPVSRTASPWLGEAAAVARDAAEAHESGVAPDVVADRVGHVRRLLSEFDGTDDTAADEHVEAARSLAAEVATRLPDPEN